MIRLGIRSANYPLPNLEWQAAETSSSYIINGAREYRTRDKNYDLPQFKNQKDSIVRVVWYPQEHYSESTRDRDASAYDCQKDMARGFLASDAVHVINEPSSKVEKIHPVSPESEEREKMLDLVHSSMPYYEAPIEQSVSLLLNGAASVYAKYLSKTEVTLYPPHDPNNEKLPKECEIADSNLLESEKAETQAMDDLRARDFVKELSNAYEKYDNASEALENDKSITIEEKLERFDQLTKEYDSASNKIEDESNAVEKTIKDQRKTLERHRIEWDFLIVTARDKALARWIPKLYEMLVKLHEENPQMPPNEKVIHVSMGAYHHGILELQRMHPGIPLKNFHTQASSFLNK